MTSRSPSPVDLDLLSRLNALKRSQITLDKSSSISVSNASPTDELAARFLKFNANREPSVADNRKEAGSSHVRENDEGENPSPNLEGDKTVEELLSDLGPEDQWTLNPEDPKEIARLLDEAKTSLAGNKTSSTITSQERSSQVNNAQQEVSVEEEGAAGMEIDSGQTLDNATASQVLDPDDPENEETAGAEAEAYLQQILDELAIGEGSDDEHVGTTILVPKEESTLRPLNHGRESNTGHVESLPQDLPSTPSCLPRLSTSSPPAALTDDSDPLQLPSVPTNAPSRMSKKSKSNLPTYSDGEIDTWCVICNDDATVRCMGCDGDLYCAKCWREGHIGPDAGYEEKQHRWTKYVRPR